MITLRKANERGHADHGWLNTYHTFSFAGYHDPNHVHFRTLRVINEDRVAPGAGFGTHPHNDMEIVTYVLDGALEHRDSMGNGGVIHAGEVQRMSAGTGVTHSEYNHSSDEQVHFLQIWIFPDRKGIEPSYEQKSFSEADRTNRLRLIVSPAGTDGSMNIHQDVKLYASILEPGSTVTHQLAPDRHAWLQLTSGALTLNGQTIHAGDGAAVSEEQQLEINATDRAEFLLFDLA
jgi:redox-sensitive bicupin YhaK (pirin superfamily)